MLSSRTSPAGARPREHPQDDEHVSDVAPKVYNQTFLLYYYFIITLLLLFFMSPLSCSLGARLVLRVATVRLRLFDAQKRKVNL